MHLGHVEGSWGQNVTAGYPLTQIRSLPVAAGCIKRIAERSLFPSVGSFVALVRPSFRFAFQQDDELRESSFDATTAHNAVFRSYLFSIANYPMDFAPRRACSGPRGTKHYAQLKSNKKILVGFFGTFLGTRRGMDLPCEAKLAIKNKNDSVFGGVPFS
jgi:hypothetical protein